MTPEAQRKIARQRNELRDQAETIARLRREKMELLRDLKAAKAEKLRATPRRWADEERDPPSPPLCPVI
jgi:predicted RNase H-like nuclease (RuvC/YqgF family)